MVETVTRKLSRVITGLMLHALNCRQHGCHLTADSLGIRIIELRARPRDNNLHGFNVRADSVFNKPNLLQNFTARFLDVPI
jgi:hypothetical protein